MFPSAVSSLCTSILRELGQPGCALSIVFVGARKMRSLNSRYRGKAYTTDVLSFTYQNHTSRADGGRAAGRGRTRATETACRMEEVPYLGDIVISPQIACVHAERYGVLPEKEIRRLLVHGILHLLGYDHEADHREMMHLQERLLRRRSLRDALPVSDIAVEHISLPKGDA